MPAPAPLFTAVPELAAFAAGAAGIRIPPDVTVPLTPRVRRLLDTPPLRRLARVSQLGLVSLVYPGAVHSRLEHSLGVFRLAGEFLLRLGHDPRFAAVVTVPDAEAFLVAALVHDLGHWAYCHPLEDMDLPEIPRHESLIADILREAGPATALAEDWGLQPDRVAALVLGTAPDPAGRILHSLLSGPIDVDKMDYLARDSLHAGVPYGRHFDESRLLASLCLDEPGRGLAITEKGRTAAELLVFARYVMFSEVYWHHAVRAATAMLQRAIWLSRSGLDIARLIRSDDHSFVDILTTASTGTPAAAIVAGLFGPHRRLFKRAATFDAVRQPAIHAAIAGRGYAGMTAISQRLAARLSERLGTTIDPAVLLVDAAPAAREIEFRLQVRERVGTGPTGTGGWRRLEDVSPVVRSLAHEQFDDLVKKVRIFAPSELAAAIAGCPDLEPLVLAAADG